MEDHERSVAVGLLVVLLVAGTLYARYLGDRLVFPEEQVYHTLAQALDEKGIYSLDGRYPTASRPPGYPLFLLAVRRLGGSTAAMRWANFVALAFCLLGLSSTVRREAPFPAGLATVVLGGFYPIAFYLAGTLHAQTLGSAILAVMVWIAFRKPGLSWGAALAIGLLAGALWLTVQAMAFAPVFLAAWMALGPRHGRAKAVLMLLVAGLVLCPWAYRNARVMGAPILISTTGGWNLLVGNSPYSRPEAGTGVDLSAYALPPDTPEVETDRFYRREALRFMRSHPGAWVSLYVRKFFHYFHYRNRLVTAEENRPGRETIMLVTYGPLLMAALVRLLSAFRVPLSRYERFAYGLYVLNGLFAAVFYPRLRYRVPYDLVLMSAVVAGVCRWSALRHDRRASGRRADRKTSG